MKFWSVLGNASIGNFGGVVTHIGRGSLHTGAAFCAVTVGYGYTRPKKQPITLSVTHLGERLKRVLQVEDE
jgi:hypothetical protein